MSSPTQRSLEHLRKLGYEVAIVEKWVPNSPRGFKGSIIRKDVWGYGDLLCYHPEKQGALLVQTTSGSNAGARIAKIKGIPQALGWLRAGNRIVVHGWAQRGPRGQKKVWTCGAVEITKEMLQQ